MHKKESWLSPKTEIRKSATEGKGLFAKDPIARGERIVVFGGIYGNKQEAEAAQLKSKLIMQWDIDLFSIEDRGDDPTYFINHSCNGNLWMTDAYILETSRDIHAGEELTADYSLWEANEHFVSSWTCKCGSADCRKQITGKDWRILAVQQRYKNHFSPLINNRIQRLQPTKE